MASEQAEVRVKLVADDAASAIVEGVKVAMREMREEQEKATKASGKGGLTGSLIKANVATELIKGSAELVTTAIHQAYEMTEKLVDASMEAADAQEKQVRAMSGGLFLMDAGKHSMEAIRDYSADMREEFSKMGIASGIATSQITEAFNQLVSRGTMGSEAAKELTLQMAQVGKVVPGGMESLAQGFSMIELGMVKAKNPVVQLIAATHVLKGNAHAVAQQMQKMTPEKQMELGEKAIKAQAEQLRKMGGMGPVTMPELKQSFEGVKESFLESMGKPIEDALIPHLTALRDFLAAHIEEIKGFAETVGRDVGEVIDYVSNVVEGMYEGFSQNWTQIKAAFEDVFGDWYRAWESARKDTSGIKEEFKGIAEAFVGMLKPILQWIKAAAEVAMQVNDMIHGRSAGSSQASIQKTSAESVAANAVAGGDKSMAAIDLEIQKYKQLAIEQGVSKESADAYAASLHDQAEANMRASEQAKNSLDSGNFEAFNSYVADAIKNQSDGAEQYAFKLLTGSEDARKAFVAGADNIAGGMDAIMKVVEEKSPELAKQLKELQGGRVGKEGILPPQHSMNFYGANFHIKQDFKDSDPDRMMLLFRKDIANSAKNRIQARTSVPFGL